MKTAFVTGSTGCLGVNLVSQLAAAGWQVHALHRKSSNVTALKRIPGDLVKLVEGAIGDTASLERALPEGVDAVFHVAGNTTMWKVKDADQTRDNVEGTRNVLKAAKSRKARRFLFTSTVGAWGIQPEVNPLDETAVSNVMSSFINYSKTKYTSEQDVKQAISEGLDAVILNPAYMVGPYDTGNWSGLFQMVHEGKLSGVMPGASNWAHVKDVAAGHIAAAERGRTGHNYILGGPKATYLEVVQTVARLAGRTPPTKTMSPLMMRIVSRVMYWGSLITKKEPDLTPEFVALTNANLFYNSSKAETELGFKSSTIEEMVGDCYRWMLEVGMIKKNAA